MVPRCRSRVAVYALNTHIDDDDGFMHAHAGVRLSETSLYCVLEVGPSTCSLTALPLSLALSRSLPLSPALSRSPPLAPSLQANVRLTVATVYRCWPGLWCMILATMRCPASGGHRRCLRGRGGRGAAMTVRTFINVHSKTRHWGVYV